MGIEKFQEQLNKKIDYLLDSHLNLEACGILNSLDHDELEKFDADELREIIRTLDNAYFDTVAAIKILQIENEKAEQAHKNIILSQQRELP